MEEKEAKKGFSLTRRQKFRLTIMTLGLFLGWSWGYFTSVTQNGIGLVIVFLIALIGHQIVMNNIRKINDQEPIEDGIVTPLRDGFIMMGWIWGCFVGFSGGLSHGLHGFLDAFVFVGLLYTAEIINTVSRILKGWRSFIIMESIAFIFCVLAILKVIFNIHF
jgi:hypothetical protein